MRDAAVFTPAVHASSQNQQDAGVDVVNDMTNV